METDAVSPKEMNDAKRQEVTRGLRDRGYPNVGWHSHDAHLWEENMPFGEYRSETTRKVPSEDIIRRIEECIQERKLPRDVDIRLALQPMTHGPELGNVWIEWTINNHYDLDLPEHEFQMKPGPAGCCCLD